MSVDKLAEAIGMGWFSSGAVYSPDAAATYVREQFVVIDRDDLPEVKPGDGAYNIVDGHVFSKTADPDVLTREGLQYLAMVEHLHKDSPAEALALDLIDRPGAPLTYAQAQIVAQRLVSEGWTKTEQ